MELKHSRELTARAQELRRNSTPEEKHLWYDFLNSYPLRFRRQVTFDRFIVDFYCHAAKLVIELDGLQHYEEDALQYDLERTNVLNGLGIEVLRIPNSEINNNFDDTCKLIDKTVNERLQ